MGKMIVGGAEIFHKLEPEPHKTDWLSNLIFARVFTKIVQNLVIFFRLWSRKCEKISFVSTLEMPECRNTGKNVSPASLVLPLVRRGILASALRSVRYRSSRIIPVVPSYGCNEILQSCFFTFNAGSV
jgi:hypothetical protein